ncbi:MAG TPA: IPT/TIG domain-containing protein [Candidatus Acidoferrales bacterium]|nr:IPT/TIG domain-containing protein [Candidatus Acidoferrales bacterium]
MGPRFSSAFLFFLLPAAFAQSSFNGRCQVTSVPIQVRGEGLTERLGDINLQCSGAAPGTVLSGNVIVYLPVAVTNRVDANNVAQDAVIYVDTSSSIATAAVPGLVSANSVSFNGLNFPAPNGSINLKISGIRGAVSSMGLAPQLPVTASVSSPLLANQAQVPVGYTQGGLTATLYSTGITCYGSAAPSTLTLSNLFTTGTAFASTRLTEGFASAFQAKQAGADNGVRFLVKYSGFPSNAHIYIPDAVAGSDAAVPTAGGDLGFPQAVGQYVPGSNTLVLVRVSGADATGAGGLPVFPPQGSGPQLLDSASEVTLTSGAGYAVYEVADANPAVMETAQFPTFFAIPNVTAPAVASESVSLAPVSGTASASQTAPVVRFLAVNPPTDCTTLTDCNAPYFPKLFVDASSIQIGAIANSKTMTTQPGYIPIRNASGGLLAWNVVISYQTGSGWLYLDYPSGTGNGSVRVWSDATNLGAGAYQATVTINAGSAGSQTIPLTLTVAPAPPPPPSVTVSQVLNAATLTQTPLVAGSLGTIMGSHLSGKNVSVTFDGAAAALLYTSDTQINFQAPASLASKTHSTLVVTADGNSSAPVTVTLSPAWPAIFPNGVLNQDNSPNGNGAGQHAAAAGDILQIFATGIPQGALVSAQIGDQKNLVPLYTGDAPGITGVQQVNVAVPSVAGAAASLVLCATPPGGQAYCSTGYQVVLH